MENQPDNQANMQQQRPQVVVQQQLPQNYPQMQVPAHIIYPAANQLPQVMPSQNPQYVSNHPPPLRPP
ncbi:hypothetical protein FGO68_gene903 [Halteria grandinella]|uniref:Uncharacterized protein n=1 Tax=Halteria grandinella TaxID=5974 RepID=A0A8J8NC91_HALGN|nr:hypothetical protein FGO68_gene903 [Halteria grandinella]